MLCDEIEAGTQFTQIPQQVLADVTEDFPQGLTGLQTLGFGKAA